MTRVEIQAAESREHIRQLEARIARQQRLIEELRRGGHDTSSAEALLRQLISTLEQMQSHGDALGEEPAKAPSASAPSQ